jgi:hypothetical protein
MSNPPVQPSTTTGIRVVSILLPCFLIGYFIWKLLSPTPHTGQVMTMVFYFGMVLSLCSFRREIPAPLFWIGLVAGAGLFALLLQQTGYLVPYFPPR